MYICIYVYIYIYILIFVGIYPNKNARASWSMLLAVPSNQFLGARQDVSVVRMRGYPDNENGPARCGWCHLSKSCAHVTSGPEPSKKMFGQSSNFAGGSPFAVDITVVAWPMHIRYIAIIVHGNHLNICLCISISIHLSIYIIIYIYIYIYIYTPVVLRSYSIHQKHPFGSFTVPRFWWNRYVVTIPWPFLEEKQPLIFFEKNICR